MEERKIAEAQIESFCQYLIPVNFFYTKPKKAVLETYRKALHPQKPTPDKGSEPKKAKKKSSEIEL